MRYQVTSRVNAPVSLELAKEHLRLTHSLEDNLVQIDVDGALEWAEEYTGAGFGTLTVEATAELVQDAYTIMKYLPVISVTSVKDSDGNDIDYEFDGDTVVEITGDIEEPPIITYEGGYGTGTPQRCTQAMLLDISAQYDYRSDRQVQGDPYSARTVSERLLYPYKQLEWLP